jgi:hypothetical protein
VNASLDLILYVVAAVLFAIAAFWSPGNPPRFNLVAGGLFFFTLAQIL